MSENRADLFGRIKTLIGKPRDQKSVFLVYGIMTLILFSLVIITGSIYSKQQALHVGNLPSISMKEFIDDGKVTVVDKNILLTLSGREFGQMIQSQLDTVYANKSTKVSGYLYDSKSGQAYISMKTKDGKEHTFICSVKVKDTKEGLSLKFSDYRLGRLKSRLFAFPLKFVMHVPSGISLPKTSSYKLLTVSDIKIDASNNVVSTLVYDKAALLERLASYKKNVSLDQLNAYRSGGETPQVFIDVMEKQTLDDSDLNKFINEFETNQDAIVKLALLLQEAGIKDVCYDFLKLYNKGMSTERILKKAQGKLEQDLQKFHFELTKAILGYLHANENYTDEGNRIYVNGNLLKATDFMINNNLSTPWAVEIVSNDQSINLEYKLGDRNLSKVILRKE